MAYLRTGEDILVDMHYMDLGFISGYYRNNPHVCYASSCASNGFVINHLQLKSTPVTFMSPHELWKKNGLFFVLMKNETFYEIGIFTPSVEKADSVHNAIFSGLWYTKKIRFDDISRFVIFKQIHESLHYVVKTFLDARNIELEVDEKFHINKIPMHLALQFNIKVPDEVEMIPLRREYASHISRSWPHQTTVDESYIRNLIKICGGYGLFSKKNGRLLSWGLKTMMGTIDFVQTIESFRRNGYASVIVKKLAMEIAQKNHHPIATSRVSDTTSFLFLEDLGFNSVGFCHDIHVKLNHYKFNATFKKLTAMTQKNLLKTISKPTMSSVPGPSIESPSSSTCDSINISPFKRSPPATDVHDTFAKKKFRLSLLEDTLSNANPDEPGPSNVKVFQPLYKEADSAEDSDPLQIFKNLDCKVILPSLSPRSDDSNDTNPEEFLESLEHHELIERLSPVLDLIPKYEEDTETSPQSPPLPEDSKEIGEDTREEGEDIIPKVEDTKPHSPSSGYSDDRGQRPEDSSSASKDSEESSIEILYHGSPTNGEGPAEGVERNEPDVGENRENEEVIPEANPENPVGAAEEVDPNLQPPEAHHNGDVVPGKRRSVYVSESSMLVLSDSSVEDEMSSDTEEEVVAPANQHIPHGAAPHQNVQNGDGPHNNNQNGFGEHHVHQNGNRSPNPHPNNGVDLHNGNQNGIRFQDPGPQIGVGPQDNLGGREYFVAIFVRENSPLPDSPNSPPENEQP